MPVNSTSGTADLVIDCTKYKVIYSNLKPLLWGYISSFSQITKFKSMLLNIFAFLSNPRAPEMES